MMSYWQTINDQFPVRKDKPQKEAFRAWAVKEMETMGYRAKVEVNGRGKHTNVVAGDPEHAVVLFTAHYDTPARMLLPNLIIPRNIPLFIAYQVLNVLLLLIPAVLVMTLVGGLTANFTASYLSWIVTYFTLLVVMIAGPANPHNANDNTSGVAAVMDLMAALPEGVRGKVAFILFDNEEKGKLGSKGLVVHQPAEVGHGDQARDISRPVGCAAGGCLAMEQHAPAVHDGDDIHVPRYARRVRLVLQGKLADAVRGFVQHR